MRCHNCAGVNKAGARYCNDCGSELTVGDRVESRPGAVATVEPERRQITFLFCDIKDSVRLVEQFDPEEWGLVIAHYQAAVNKVVARFEGQIARTFGDGILVYFGYPPVHEDEAQRAVRSALGIVE